MFERQIIYENIGEERQKLIESSTVCVIGVGALGTNTSESLVRSGVKNLILIDDDSIEEHNLQRQCLFNQKDINKSKVEVAKEKLQEINPKVKITIQKERLTKDTNIKSDLVLDCTDNIETRFLINDLCMQNNIPWIYSSAIESTGYVLVIYPKKTPCFSCVIKEPNETLGDCETRGILNTIAKAISSIQVTEALKILTKQPFTKELIHFDIWKNKLTKTKVKKNPDCQTCKGNFQFLENQIKAKKCKSRGAYITRPNGKQELDLEKVRKNFKVIADTPVVTIIQDKFKVSCYKNGKLLIECDNEKDAEEQAGRIYK